MRSCAAWSGKCWPAKWLIHQTWSHTEMPSRLSQRPRLFSPGLPWVPILPVENSFSLSCDLSMPLLSTVLGAHGLWPALGFSWALLSCCGEGTPLRAVLQRSTLKTLCRSVSVGGSAGCLRPRLCRCLWFCGGLSPCCVQILRGKKLHFLKWCIP